MMDDETRDIDKYLEQEVIDVHRPTFGSPRIVSVHSHKQRTCTHTHVFVIKNRHVVVCRSCGDQVDPFDVLLQLTHEWGWATHWQQKREDDAKEVERLKAEEQRIKARIRNARRKIQGADVDGFVQEYVQRLNDAKTREDLWAAANWADSFSLLNMQQRQLIREARERAELRVKHASRKRKRLEVMDGGAEK